MNILCKLQSISQSELQTVLSKLSVKELESLEIELARQSFYHFSKYISSIYDETVDMTFPTYVMTCEVAQAFMENRLFAKINDKYERVDMFFFNACPGWGKSYLITRLLNLWWLAKNHKLQYIITANEKNRKKIMDDIRVLMSLHKFQSIFDDFKLIKNNDGEKVTDKQGYLYMNPSRSDITGTRGDLFIFDDFFKPTNITRAEHQTSKDFLDRYMTRGFKKNKRITKRIIVEQRIDLQDATGYLMENYKEGGLPYCQLKIPYLFEQDTEYEFYIENQETKQIESKNYSFLAGSFSSGEFSLAKYNTLLFTDYNGNVNRRQTECQQEPTTSDTIVKFTALNYLHPDVINDIDFDYTILSVDPASSDNHSADNTAFVFIGFRVENATFYIINVFKKKMEYVEIEERFRFFYAECSKIKPIDMIVIEGTSSGTSLYSKLKGGQIKNPLNNEPIIASAGIHKFIPTQSKVIRLDKVIAYINNLQMPTHATWLTDYVNEFVSFPNAKHDDMVDATVQGISHLLKLRNR